MQKCMRASMIYISRMFAQACRRLQTPAGSNAPPRPQAGTPPVNGMQRCMRLSLVKLHLADVQPCETIPMLCARTHACILPTCSDSWCRSHLQIIWQLCPASVPWVHGDEHAASWQQRHVTPLKEETLRTGTQRSLVAAAAAAETEVASVAESQAAQVGSSAMSRPSNRKGSAPARSAA
jgi:hypothetical protein